MNNSAEDVRMIRIELPAWVLRDLLGLPKDARILDISRPEGLRSHAAIELLVEHWDLPPVREGCAVSTKMPTWTKCAEFESWDLMQANHPQESHEPRAMVESERPYCGSCGSEQVYVTHTDVPVRHMKCQRCLSNFKVIISYRMYITALKMA